MSLQTPDESEQNIDWNDETSLRGEGKVRLLPFVRRLSWRGTTGRYSNQHGRLSVAPARRCPLMRHRQRCCLGLADTSPHMLRWCLPRDGYSLAGAHCKFKFAVSSEQASQYDALRKRLIRLKARHQ
jgi:hypothetical protein